MRAAQKKREQVARGGGGIRCGENSLKFLPARPFEQESFPASPNRIASLSVCCTSFRCRQEARDSTPALGHRFAPARLGSNGRPYPVDGGNRLCDCPQTDDRPDCGEHRGGPDAAGDDARYAGVDQPSVACRDGAVGRSAEPHPPAVAAVCHRSGGGLCLAGPLLAARSVAREGQSRSVGCRDGGGGPAAGGLF